MHDEKKTMFDTYSFTSHERSCEQNGQGNDRVSASIRFCFGGGLRFDLRLPMARSIEFYSTKEKKNECDDEVTRLINIEDIYSQKMKEHFDDDDESFFSPINTERHRWRATFVAINDICPCAVFLQC
jgi:hypothetical protein